MGVVDEIRAGPFPRMMSASLNEVALSHTLRCDARQSERRFQVFDAWIAAVPHWRLGDHLPTPIVKGIQPHYLEINEEGGVPVISTMAIQDLAIDEAACRRAVDADYGDNDVRRPQGRDVLLTVDGGTSIGKPVLFDLAGDWAVDSHVAILRPAGIDPELLVYLLASPIGQIQFQRAESGASGQTSVTEEDLRRFIFPAISKASAKQALSKVRKAIADSDRLRRQAEQRQVDGWDRFTALYIADL